MNDWRDTVVCLTFAASMAVCTGIIATAFIIDVMGACS